MVALEGINLELAGPTITGIIGPNGAGKSTLSKQLNMIDHIGQVFLGVPAKKMLKSITSAKRATLISTFQLSNKECVSLGTYSNLGIFRKVSKKEWNKVGKRSPKLA